MQQIDVFISYKREERHLADTVARALKDAGYVAVTDLNIQKATDFGEAIDKLIQAAKVVVVLWTHASAASDWVRKEANEADRLKKYLGVRVEPIEPEDLPLQVRSNNWLDMSTGTPSDSMPLLLAEVRRLVGEVHRTLPEAEAETQNVEKDLEFYQVVKKIGDLGGFRKYIEVYPNGSYVDDAKAHILRETRWYARLRRFPVFSTITAVGVLVGAYVSLERFVFDDQETASLTRQIAALETQLATAQSDLGEAQSERTSLTEQLEVARATPAADPEEIRALEDSLKAAEDRANWAVDQANALADQRDAAEAALDATANSRAALQQQMDTLSAKLNDTEDKAARLQADLNKAQTELAALRPVDPVTPVSDCTEDGKPGVLLQDIDLCVALDTKELDLTGEEKLRDISSLSHVKGLRILYLRDTGVENVDALSDLLELQQLSLRATHVRHIHMLEKLKNLRMLRLSETDVQDLSVLSNFDNLGRLYLDGTDVEDLSALTGLERLHKLELPNNGHAGEWTNDTPENRKEVQELIANWEP